MFVNDLAKAGFIPLQCHDPKYKDNLQTRIAAFATRVTGMGPLGHYVTEQGADAVEGDILCSTLWQPRKVDAPTPPQTQTKEDTNAGFLQLGGFSSNSRFTPVPRDQGTTPAQSRARAIPGWAFTWPVIVTKGNTDTQGQSLEGVAPIQESLTSSQLSPGSTAPVTYAGNALQLKPDSQMGGTRAKPPSQTQQRGTGGLQVLPVWNRKWDPDERFDPLNIDPPPSLAQKYPKGTVGIVLSATEEKEQHELFIPVAGAPLVAVHRAGDPSMGSLVSDLTPTSEIDKNAQARLHSMMRVVRPAAGGLLPLQVSPARPLNALAWVLGTGGRDSIPGFGLVYDGEGAPLQALDAPPTSRVPSTPTPENDATRTRTKPQTPGGSTTTGGSGGAGSTRTNPANTGTKRGIIGVTTCRGGGPFDVGGAGDVHHIGVTADGEPINSTHLSTRSLFRGHGGDAHLAFTPVVYSDPQELPIRTRVHLRYDPKASHDWFAGPKPGLWRWEGESAIWMPPPEDPPPPEQPPRIPPPGGGGKPPPPTEPIKAYIGAPWHTIYPKTPPKVPGGKKGVGLINDWDDPGKPWQPPSAGSCQVGLNRDYRTGGVSWAQTGPNIVGAIGDWFTGTTEGGPAGWPGPAVSNNSGSTTVRTPGAPMPGSPSSPHQKMVNNNAAANAVRSATPRDPSEGGEQHAETPSTLSVPAIIMKPMLQGAGNADLRSSIAVGMNMLRAMGKAPVTGRMEAFAAQSSGEFVKSTSTRFGGGTANGGFVILPPEVDVTDHGTDFSPAGITKSTTRVVYGGGVKTGHGSINMATGGFKSGVEQYNDGDSGLTMNYVDSSSTSTGTTGFNKNRFATNFNGYQMATNSSRPTGAVAGTIWYKNDNKAYLYNGTTDLDLTAGSGVVLTIQEEDGTPSGTPSALKFPNGTLTDNGDGTYSYSGSGGGSSVNVQEEDGAPLVSSTTIKVPNGTLTDNGGGSVSVNYQPGNAKLTAVAGLSAADGQFIVGDGATFVGESGSTARTSLGVGTIATQDANNVNISGGAITGITDLAVTDGGTGASSAAGARTNLDAQQAHANLTAFSGLTFASDKMIYTDEAGSLVTNSFSTCLDDMYDISGASEGFILRTGTAWSTPGSTPRSYLGSNATAVGQQTTLNLAEPNTAGASTINHEIETRKMTTTGAVRLDLDCHVVNGGSDTGGSHASGAVPSTIRSMRNGTVVGEIKGAVADGTNTYDNGVIQDGSGNVKFIAYDRSLASTWIASHLTFTGTGSTPSYPVSGSGILYISSSGAVPSCRTTNGATQKTFQMIEGGVAGPGAPTGFADPVAEAYVASLYSAIQATQLMS